MCLKNIKVTAPVHPLENLLWTMHLIPVSITYTTGVLMGTNPHTKFELLEIQENLNIISYKNINLGKVLKYRGSKPWHMGNLWLGFSRQLLYSRHKMSIQNHNTSLWKPEIHLFQSWPGWKKMIPYMYVYAHTSRHEYI